MTEPGKPRFETTALIISVLLLVAALIGVYLPISAAKHIWPYGTDASAALEASTQNEVPAAYQHTWDGQIGIRFTRISIEISLKLGSGQVSDLVGSISSPTFGCAAFGIPQGQRTGYSRLRCFKFVRSVPDSVIYKFCHRYPAKQ